MVDNNSRQKTTFATFYTNEKYREDALRLQRCCEHFGLPFLMVEGQELGGWQRNCNQKPRLIEKVRNEILGPIAWLDSDCIIHHVPEVIKYWREEDAMLWEGGVTHKHYISSQVNWWNDTPTARAMVSDWAQLSRDNPESLADPLLKATCEKWHGKANIGKLPPEYLKPYWFDVEGVDSSESIVISSNERRCIHPDAKTKTVRVRLDPLSLPFS